MPKPIQIPKDLADLLKDKQRLKDAIALLSALGQVKGELVNPTASNTLNRGKPILLGDPPDITLQLPFRFTRRVTTLPDLIAQLDAIGFNPP